MAAPDEANVRSVILSLLVSSLPNKLRANQLEREFREMEGYNIPYAKFGFKTLVDYLKSISGTVQILDSSANPTLAPLTTEKSSHIKDMILKQKKPPNKGHQRPERRNHDYVSQSSNRQPRSRSRKKTFASRMPQSRLHGIASSHVFPKQPESSINAITDYHKTLSMSAASSVGFDCLQNQIDSFKKLVLDTNFHSSLNSPRSLNNSQNKFSKQGDSRNFHPHYRDQPNWNDVRFSGSNNFHYPPANYNPYSGHPLRQMQSQVNMPPPNYQNPKPFKGHNRCSSNERAPQTSSPSPKNTVPPTSRVKPAQQIPSNPPATKKGESESWVGKRKENVVLMPAGSEPSSSTSPDYTSDYFETTKECIQPFTEEFDDSDLNDRIQKNFKKLLLKNPNGFLCSDLPNLYETEFGAPLDYEEYGYDSIIQMVSHHPKTFSFSRLDKTGDWLLTFPVAKEKRSENSRPNPLVPRKVIDNIVFILKRFPAGLPMNQLLQKYKEFHKQSFDFNVYGNSLEEVIEDLDNRIHQRRLANDILLLYRDPSICEKNPPADSPALPDSVKLDILHKELYPTECCGPDFVIPIQTPPRKKVSTKAHFFEVRVSDLENPTKLWFQLGKSYDDLMDMMEDLHKFYESYGSDYTMPEVTIKPRQLCACLFGTNDDRRWHRAIILSILKFSEVKVEYIDYGTKGKVSNSTLRFLHKDFSKLPAQAIQGKLICISPPDGCKEWPLLSNERLIDLTFDRRLMFELCVINKKEGWIGGFLFDTNGDDDIEIQKELIDRNLAIGIAPPQEYNSFEESPPDFHSTIQSSSEQPDKSKLTWSCKSYEESLHSSGSSSKVNRKPLRSVNVNMPLSSCQFRQRQFWKQYFGDEVFYDKSSDFSNFGTMCNGNVVNVDCLDKSIKSSSSECKSSDDGDDFKSDSRSENVIGESNGSTHHNEVLHGNSKEITTIIHGIGSLPFSGMSRIEIDNCLKRRSGKFCELKPLNERTLSNDLSVASQTNGVDTEVKELNGLVTNSLQSFDSVSNTGCAPLPITNTRKKRLSLLDFMETSKSS